MSERHIFIFLLIVFIPGLKRSIAGDKPDINRNKKSRRVNSSALMINILQFIYRFAAIDFENSEDFVVFASDPPSEPDCGNSEVVVVLPAYTSLPVESI